MTFLERDNEINYFCCSTMLEIPLHLVHSTEWRLRNLPLYSPHNAFTSLLDSSRRTSRVHFKLSNAPIVLPSKPKPNGHDVAFSRSCWRTNSSSSLDSSSSKASSLTHFVAIFLRPPRAFPQLAIYLFEYWSCYLFVNHSALNPIQQSKWSFYIFWELTLMYFGKASE